MSQLLCPAPSVPAIPVRGRPERVAVRRICCVGRNYEAHAREMGVAVNGETKQPLDLSLLIHTVPEVVAHSSGFSHLQPGDVVDTGTPEGVGPVRPGDVLEGSIAGVGTITLTIGAPA